MNTPYALSIVIPVFNSAGTIEPLVRQLAELSIAGGHEIILVNDGSRDQTFEVCQRLVREVSVPVTLVDHARNFGEHNAVLTGLRQAHGEYVINMDDDFQNPPSEVVKLYQYARQSGYDVVYTCYPEKHHAHWRNWGSWLTNAVANVVLEKPRDLYLSSFRCMSAFLVAQICQYDGPFPYIDGLILQSTQKIGRLEVIHAAREVGQSNYTLRKLIRLWLNMFVNFSILPLHVSTLIGLCLSFCGLLLAIIVVVERLLIGTPLGYSSLICVVLVFSGVQLLSLGLIGEYLGRLYLTANKRPQSIIRQIIK